MKKRREMKKRVCAGAILLSAAMVLAACGNKSEDLYDDEYTFDESDDTTDYGSTDTDINLDALNDSAKAIADLDLVGNANNGSDAGTNDAGTNDADTDAADTNDADTDDSSVEGDTPAGELTVYSYVDFYRDGNDLTLVPNGGLNEFTQLYNDKDLAGFLDYVDSTVLEEGRTINRELFYDVLSCMLGDKDIISDQTQIEKNMIMALAVANNFHAMKVRVRECCLDANNAAEYRFKITADGAEDTWVVNFSDRTFYMNDGATEYVSDMFKDEYLAIWYMAIDEYYGIDSLNGAN